MVDGSKSSFEYVVVDCHDGHILVLEFGGRKKEKNKRVKNVLSLSYTVIISTNVRLKTKTHSSAFLSFPLYGNYCP